MKAHPLHMLGILVFVCALPVSATVYSVNSYGAVPDDGNDDYQAVANAVWAASASAGNTVQFGNGTYCLSQKLLHADREGVTVKGGGKDNTLLVRTGDFRDGVFQFMNCSSEMKFEDFSVQYSKPPWTQGLVSNLNHTAKTFTFSIDTYFSDLDDTDLGFLSDGGAFGNFHYDDTSIINAWNVGDEIRGRIVKDTPSAVWVDWNQSYKISTGVWHLKVSDTSGAYNNCKFVQNIRGDAALIGYGQNPVDMRCNRVRINQSPGICFAAVGLNRLYVTDCESNFQPSPNGCRIVTGCDGAHSQNCRYGIYATGNYFTGMQDDGINNYAIGYTIVSKLSDTRYQIQFEMRPLAAGHALTFFDGDTGLYDSYGITVSSVESTWESGGSWYATINISRAPYYTMAIGDTVFNTTFGSEGFYIANNTFTNYRGRGVLLSASDGTVTNNTMHCLSGPGIVMSNDTSWNQGLRCCDVSVDSNNIWNCLWDGESHLRADYGAISATAYDKYGNYVPTSYNVHYNTVIEDNDILRARTTDTGILVTSTTGITVQNNTIRDQ